MVWMKPGFIMRPADIMNH